MGDGDQSPLTGARAQHARERMAAVGEGGFSLHSLPTDFQKAAWTGHVQMLTHFLLSPLREGLLAQREPQLNFSVLHLVVLGAQRLAAYKGPPDMVNFPQALELLLKAGANVHACDCNGHTALHHATFNDSQLELARILIKHGADVNARNRFGHNCLFEPVMQNNYEVCKLLYDCGANPDLKDCEGYFPTQLVKAHPRLVALFERPREVASKAGEGSPKEVRQTKDGKKVKEAKPEEELEAISCAACGKSMIPPVQRCARCHVRPYCGAECQKQDWKAHKVTCKKDAPNEHAVEVTPSAVPGQMSSVPWSQFMQKWARAEADEDESEELPEFHTLTDEKNAHFLRKERNFIVKIQVEMDIGTRKPKKGGALMAYDKTRKFQCLIEASDPGHKKLFELITREDGTKLKGYFNAYVNKSSKLVIITQPLLPPQPW